MRDAALAVLVALALVECAPACQPSDAVRVHVQTLAGVPIDDATVACSVAGSVVETVPLGMGDYVCGHAAGFHDVTVTHGSTSVSRRVSAWQHAETCAGLNTAVVLLALPDR